MKTQKQKQNQKFKLSILLFLLPHLSLQSLDPQPLPNVKKSTKFTILKLSEISFKIQETDQMKLYNGIAVLQETQTDNYTRNASFFAYLVPPEEMMLFPKDYTEIRMEGFNLSDPMTNTTDGMYFGNVNCSFFTFNNNFKYNSTTLSQISLEWRNGSEFNINGARNFTLMACSDPFTCSSVVAPLPQNVEDITDKGALKYSVLVYFTFPITLFLLFKLFFLKDIRRIPGHSMLFLAINTLLFTCISANRGGQMGFDSSYNLAFLFSVVSFFSLVLGTVRVRKRLKEEESLRKWGLERYMLVTYFFFSVILFPLTKNRASWLMSFGPLILIVDNLRRSKNQYTGYYCLGLMILIQVNWVYVYHYGYNSARLPLKWDDNGMDSFGVYLAILVDFLAVVLIHFSEHVEVDAEWQALRDVRVYKTDIRLKGVLEEVKEEENFVGFTETEDEGTGNGGSFQTGWTRESRKTEGRREMQL